jgi:hypothetical protein
VVAAISFCLRSSLAGRGGGGMSGDPQAPPRCFITRFRHMGVVPAEGKPGGGDSFLADNSYKKMKFA